MTDCRATPEQWAETEWWANCGDNTDACILELRARVEALEDINWQRDVQWNSKPTPKTFPTDEELCKYYVKMYYESLDRQGPDAQAYALRAVLERFGNFNYPEKPDS